MKFPFTTATLLFFVQVSTATELSLNSRSEDLFVCNAGARHQGSGEMCLSLATGLSCDPNIGNTESCTCLTLGAHGDYVSASVVSPAGEVQQQAPSGTDTFKSLIGPSQTFLHRLSSVGFQLGSETYGAEYFVQFCYRGPVKDIKNQENILVDESLGRYSFRMTLMGKNQSYLKKMEGIKLRYWCDLRGSGNQALARTESEKTTDDVEADLPLTERNIPFASGSLNQEINSITLNSNPTEVPRFCIFQLILKEVQNTPRIYKHSSGVFEGSIQVIKSQSPF